MARIRTIKPEFWTDAAIVECSTNARLLFVGMWNFADDYGNLDRSSKQIKGQVFPCDNIDCEPLILSLIVRGLVVEYSSNQKNYLHIQNFAKHQRIDRPGPRRCPEFDDSTIVPRSFVEDSTSIPPRKGREGKGEVKDLPTKPEKLDKKKPLPDDWIPSERTVQKLSAEFGFSNGDAERYIAAFKDMCAAHGYTYAKFDAAFSNCVRQDWPKFRSGARIMPKHANPQKPSWT